MIEVSIDTNTSALMQSLKGFGPQVMRALSKAFQRELRRTRSVAVASFRRTTMGRRLPKAASAGMMKLSRVRRDEDGLVATLSATGLAGLTETGGRTRPHLIQPRKAGVLVGAGRTGRFFARVVHHPGGPVAVRPSLQPAAEGLTDRLAAEMRAAVLDIWVGRLLDT